MKKVLFILTCFFLMVVPSESKAQMQGSITEIYSVNYGTQTLAATAVQVGNVIEVYQGGQSIKRVELAQDPYSFSQVYDLSGGSPVKQLEYRTNSLGVNEIIDYRKDSRLMEHGRSVVTPLIRYNPRE